MPVYTLSAQCVHNTPGMPMFERPDARMPPNHASNNVCNVLIFCDLCVCVTLCVCDLVCVCVCVCDLCVVSSTDHEPDDHKL